MRNEDPGTDRPSDPSTAPSYTIGSGWWCSDVDEATENPRRRSKGDSLIRSVAFFEFWRESIFTKSTPRTVVVADSHSPVKPDPRLREGIVWVELPFNARHSTDHLGKWSGWTRSVLLTGQYAVASEADYFVYVEQDCLLAGAGIVEHCIGKMTRNLMCGSGKGTPQPLQQSFFIVRGDFLATFLGNLASLEARDRDLDPEWKFVFATWRPFVIAANLGLLRNRHVRKAVLALARSMFLQDLPVGSGRARPIPEDAEFWYFQHGTEEEVSRYLKRHMSSD